MSLEPVAVEMADFATHLAKTRTLDEIERCYLQGIRTLIPLPAAGLYLLERGNSRPWRVAAVGVSEFFLTRYERLGRARDPVLAEVLRTGEPVSSCALMTEASWRGLPMYEEVHGLHRKTLCLQAPVLADSTIVGTLNFGGRDDARLPDEKRISLLGPLGRLVGAAVQSALVRHEEDRRHERVLAALSLSEEAVVVSDSSTGERTVNAAAEHLLARLDERCSDCLDRLIAGCEAMLPLVRAERVELRDGALTTLQVRVAAPRQSPDLLVCFLRLIDPHENATGNSLAQWLTERERAVAERIARGMRDSEIATELHLSRHTVRDHVKSIYRKTGATNRVALTRMMLL